MRVFQLFVSAPHFEDLFVLTLSVSGPFVDDFSVFCSRTIRYSKKLNPQEGYWPVRHAALRKVHGDDVIGTPTTMSMHGDDAVGTPYYNEGLT